MDPFGHKEQLSWLWWWRWLSRLEIWQEKKKFLDIKDTANIKAKRAILYGRTFTSLRYFLGLITTPDNAAAWSFDFGKFKRKTHFFFLFRLSCLYARNDAERKPTVLLLNGNGSPAVECWYCKGLDSKKIFFEGKKPLEFWKSFIPEYQLSKALSRYFKK